MDNSYWLSFKEENKDKWHFDPSRDSQDFTYLGRLKTNFTPLLDLMKDDKNFTEFRIVEEIKEHGTLSERIKGFREWGFTEHNTKSLQITDKEFPEILKPFKEFAGFGDCNVVALKQYPGQFLPWHQDTYVGFRKDYDVPDDVEVTRYSLMLEDWKWGHYFLAGNSVFHQWKQGDIIELPPKMHHVTCNGGMEPKLTMTITGTITEKFLKRKESKIFEY
tara:strand:+ start:28746 stop:29402 length:657 start_codon:yes stop_codon:yes gene_type:complete